MSDTNFDAPETETLGEEIHKRVARVIEEIEALFGFGHPLAHQAMYEAIQQGKIAPLTGPAPTQGLSTAVAPVPKQPSIENGPGVVPAANASAAADTAPSVEPSPQIPAETPAEDPASEETADLTTPANPPAETPAPGAETASTTLGTTPAVEPSAPVLTGTSAQGDTITVDPTTGVATNTTTGVEANADEIAEAGVTVTSTSPAVPE